MAEDVDSSTSLPKLTAGSSEVPSGTSDTKLSVEQKSEYDEYEDEETQLPTGGEMTEPLDDFMSDEDDDDTNLVVLDPNHVSLIVINATENVIFCLASDGTGPSCS